MDLPALSAICVIVLFDVVVAHERGAAPNWPIWKRNALISTIALVSLMVCLLVWWLKKVKEEKKETKKTK